MGLDSATSLYLLKLQLGFQRPQGSQYCFSLQLVCTENKIEEERNRKAWIIEKASLKVVAEINNSKYVRVNGQSANGHGTT